jgi:hypothetical protein
MIGTGRSSTGRRVFIDVLAPRLLICLTELIFRNRVKVSTQKYFSFSEVKIKLIVPPSRAHKEGRIAIVMNVGCGMRWTLRRARRAR